MGRLVFVTGGARSGKSTFAEKLASDSGDRVLYIATSVPFDDEMELRIQKHKERRPSGWQTVEAYRELDRIISVNIEEKSAVLLDCMTIMITNLMIDSGINWEKASAEELYSVEKTIDVEIDKLICTAAKTDALFIIVSNEVGMGLVPEYPMARVFRDIAGRANQKIAKASDEVFFCVSGIPMKIK